MWGHTLFPIRTSFSRLKRWEWIETDGEDDQLHDLRFYRLKGWGLKKT